MTSTTKTARNPKEAAAVSLPDPFLPPELATMTEAPQPALRAVTLRLDPVTLARLEALRDRLNCPTRCALLRFLVGEGLRSAEAPLGGRS